MYERVRFFPLIGAGILGLLLTVFSVSPATVQAQVDDLITVNAEGVSKANSSVAAAKEIQADVIANNVRERVREILGDKRYTKNRALVESKIVRQSFKFIPFVNAGAPVFLPDGSWKMKVEFKLSSSSLRKMVLDAGLLNDAEGPASILPMISFVDRQKNAALRWWMGEPKDQAGAFLSQASRQFHEAIQAEFSRQGFHVIKPQGTRYSPLPDSFQVDRPAAGEYKFISDFFQAPMIMKGDVRFKEVKSPVSAILCAIKIQVVQAHSGRTIAEVSRQVEGDTSSGNYETVIRAKLTAELPELTKDLATQVYEVWQRGTLNTNQIRLAVRASSLTPKKLGEFKAGLMGQVQQVKGMRERLFDGGSVQFEMDYAGESNSLIDRLKALKLQGFETRVSSVSDSVISMDVR